MNTQVWLLRIGGAINALFFLFHLLLGWRIHHWQLAPGLRALLEMQNGGGALYILFLAVASLAFPRELLTTHVGRAVLLFTAAMYLLRAAAETFVTPALNPAIFATCLVTGAIYLVTLLLARRAPPMTAAPAH